MFRQPFRFCVLALFLFFGVGFTSPVLALENSILDIASSDEQFSTLVDALEVAGLDGLLDNNGPFTVFAPTNDAFDAVSTVVAGLDETELRQVLLYHIVQGNLSSADVAAADTITTALGKDITVSIEGNTVILNGSAAVTMVDIAASNGTIHVIDAVLLPPDSQFEPVAPPDPDEVETPEEEVVEEAIEEIVEPEIDIDSDLLNAAIVLTTMRDIQYSFVQMVGVLDRSPEGQYPADCDEFYTYYEISFLFTLLLLFSETPFEFEDIFEQTFETVLDGLIGSEPVAFLCINGGNGHLTGHNKAAARIALTNTIEELNLLIAAGEARTGLQTESTLAQLLAEGNVEDLSPEEIAELTEVFGGEFDEEVFYEDILITQEIMRSMTGWLDKLADGQTVFCNEYALYYELLSLPTIFLFPPAEYQELYQGHLNAILTVLDTSRPLLIFCDEGGNLSEFNFGLARNGLSIAYDRLHLIEQEVARRLNIQPQ